jgi:hypothetical protein
MRSTIADAEINGSATYTITASKNHGRHLPSYIIKTYDQKEEIAMHLKSISRKSTVISWYGEDASGNQYLLGRSSNGGLWDVVTNANPTVYMPAKLKPGMSWKCVSKLKSDDTFTMECACVGMETISTTFGNLNTFKITQILMFASSGSSTGTFWLSPNLPNIFEIKTEADVESPNSKVGLIYNIKSVELAD